MRTLLLIIAILVADPALSQQSGPREPEHKAETTQQPQQSSDAFYRPTKPFSFSVFEKPVAPIVNIYTGKHADEKSQCADTKDWKEWGSFALCRSLEWIDAERVIAIWTIVLGIATCILGVATWKLWGATDRLVEGAEESARRQLQAYLSISKAKIEGVEAGRQPTVKFFIRNTGQTPAYNLWAEVAVGYGTYPIPKGTNIPVPPSPDEKSQITVGPGMRVRHGARYTMPFGSTEFEAIKNKKAAIYVVGKIRFTDAFDHRWLYNLRLTYNWRGLEADTRKLDVCEEGNEIEQEGSPPLP